MTVTAKNLHKARSDSQLGNSGRGYEGIEKGRILHVKLVRPNRKGVKSE